MGVDVAHFVLVALRHADYEVVDYCSHSAKGCDVLPRAMVDFYLDYIATLFVFGEGEANGDVGEVFCQFA